MTITNLTPQWTFLSVSLDCSFYIYIFYQYKCEFDMASIFRKTTLSFSLELEEKATENQLRFVQPQLASLSFFISFNNLCRLVPTFVAAVSHSVNRLYIGSLPLYIFCLLLPLSCTTVSSSDCNSLL